MSSTDGVPDADAALVAGEAPPSARVPLDRDRIVAAAIEFIETDGLAGLTMRRLGERLGVEAMSLYRYVPGKEDLLDAVVESLVQRWTGTARSSRPRATGGRTSCSAWPTAYDGWRWSTRRRSRWSPPGPPEAPWLRPPLRSIALGRDVPRRR